jgi:hypothetical protein
MRKSLLSFVFLALCSLLAAQQALNNDAVIKLFKAGLSDDLIIATINAQPGTYDVSTDGLVALKASGVSDKVVAAILTKGSAPAAPPAAPPTAALPPAAAPEAPADPDDPTAKHDFGVYLMTTTHEGKPKMVFIERAGEAGTKTANVAAFAFTYGIAKAKLKAEIPGQRAAARSMDSRPVFYMYFPDMNGLGSFGGSDMITSPNQFSLLDLEIKKDHRETQIARVGFASAQTGSDEKKQIPFTSERIKSGVYRLTMKQSLKPGEYAFIMATRGTSGPVGTWGAGGSPGTSVVIYDFGVDLQ